jgi:hypothetical protein
MRFDLDLSRLESDERVRDRACKHDITVRRNSCRVCVSFASRV